MIALIAMLLLTGAVVGLVFGKRTKEAPAPRRHGVTFEVVFPGVSVRRFPTLEAANEHAADCRQLGMRCLVQVTEVSGWPRR